MCAQSESMRAVREAACHLTAACMTDARLMIQPLIALYAAYAEEPIPQDFVDILEEAK